MNDARQCPWCQRWALKEGCDYIFACGLSLEGFKIGQGCGKTWCFRCGKKYCGQYIDPETGKIKDGRNTHSDCCEKENGWRKEDYCAGGCSSHCSKRYE